MASGHKALASVRAAITAATATANREPDDVTLVAVSKTHAPDAIRPLLEAGQRTFGENRVQEAAEKWPALLCEYPDVQLHMVGQLQSNKADDAVALFDFIHAVDRTSLVKALGRAMRKAQRQVSCFIQVDIGEEEQKGGCAIGDLAALLALCKAHGVPVIGLMCVPPLDREPAPYFALLAKKAGELDLPELSMGMSGDFETAVKIGATYVRVGSALFGQRG